MCPLIGIWGWQVPLPFEECLVGADVVARSPEVRTQIDITVSTQMFPVENRCLKGAHPN